MVTNVNLAHGFECILVCDKCEPSSSAAGDTNTGTAAGSASKETTVSSTALFGVSSIVLARQWCLCIIEIHQHCALRGGNTNISVRPLIDAHFIWRLACALALEYCWYRSHVQLVDLGALLQLEEHPKRQR